MNGGQSLLHVRARKADIDAVHQLIDAKVDLDAQDKVRTMDHVEIIPEILKQNLMMLEWVDAEWRYQHASWFKLADC